MENLKEMDEFLDSAKPPKWNQKANNLSYVCSLTAVYYKKEASVTKTHFYGKSKDMVIKDRQ